MLKDSTVGLIVGRIAIHISIDGENVKGESPVGRGRVVFVIVPLTPVVGGFRGSLVLVEVVPYVIGVISKCYYRGGQYGQNDRSAIPQHSSRWSRPGHSQEGEQSSH